MFSPAGQVNASASAGSKWGAGLLDEFLGWWGRQLLELVPERLRRGAAGGNALIADASEFGLITLTSRRRGGDGRLGQFRADASGVAAMRAAVAGRGAGELVLLRLAPEAALERQVVLPLAAERDPERVLAYDMERLTPFSASEVFWDYAVQLRDKARARLTLRLTIVPRVNIQGLIDLLAEAGGRPDRIEVPTSSGMRSIKLSHAGEDGGRAFWRSGPLSTQTGLIVLAVLLFLVLVSPFLHQQVALAAARDRLDALAPPMAQVDALRRRISGRGAGGDAVAAETRRLGDTLEALAAVTEILPNDSYLTEFTMRERKMTLSGLSASAPKLISGLSSDPRIRNPAFTAPVTRTEPVRLGGGASEQPQRDVFSIRAELAP